MSKIKIPEKIKIILIAKSGGKCEFRGCNKRIIKEELTGTMGNYSNFAHIIADSEDGPRGDKELSTLLAKKESNIMVLCSEHHKLVDDRPYDYTVKLLKEMKFEHESYIDKLIMIEKENKVNVVTYNCNISDRSKIIMKNEVKEALLEQKVWVDEHINLNGNNYDESEKESFYELEAENINKLFNQQIKPILSNDAKNRKIFLFAIAPQPLLIYLGSLFSDLIYVETQQFQREPQNWSLSDDEVQNFEFQIIKPKKKNKKIALNLSISGDIENTRITEALGKDIDIWKIKPNCKNSVDIIKSKQQLKKYRETIRMVYEEIKDIYRTRLHNKYIPSFANINSCRNGKMLDEKGTSNISNL